MRKAIKLIYNIYNSPRCSSNLVTSKPPVTERERRNSRRQYVQTESKGEVSATPSLKTENELAHRPETRPPKSNQHSVIPVKKPHKKL